MTPSTTDRNERALVIVPTYNERDSIPEVVRRLFDAAEGRVTLLVVDDGSPDGTAEIVRQLRHDRAIDLIERAGKLGLGTAYITGFKWAIERGYWAVVEMDADLSHDPADVPRLLDALEDGADLAIGSRYVPGGGIGNWSFLRRALSAGGNIYTRAWLGYQIKDSTSGFRAYRTQALEPQDLDSVRSTGYAFQIEMTRRIFRAGGQIVEVPITFVERAQGKSKMSRRIVIEALISVARWGLKDRFGKRTNATPADRSRVP